MAITAMTWWSSCGGICVWEPLLTISEIVVPRGIYAWTKFSWSEYNARVVVPLAPDQPCPVKMILGLFISWILDLLVFEDCCICNFFSSSSLVSVSMVSIYHRSLLLVFVSIFMI